MKCQICDRETGASWRRYCWPHWREYERKGPRAASPPSTPPRTTVTPRPIATGRKKSLLENLFSLAVTLAFYGAIAGGIGYVVWDSEFNDDEPSVAQSSAPRGYLTGLATSTSTPRLLPTVNVTRVVPTRAPAVDWSAIFESLQSQSAPVGATTYTVQPGDSWYGIADKFGITVDALLIANDLNYTSTPLYAGDVLTIPPDTFSPVFIPYQGNGGGPTLCRDGTYSHSSGRGTCSHHGGIAR